MSRQQTLAKNKHIGRQDQRRLRDARPTAEDQHQLVYAIPVMRLVLDLDLVAHHNLPAELNIQCLGLDDQFAFSTSDIHHLQD